MLINLPRRGGKTTLAIHEFLNDNCESTLIVPNSYVRRSLIEKIHANTNYDKHTLEKRILSSQWINSELIENNKNKIIVDEYILCTYKCLDLIENLVENKNYQLIAFCTGYDNRKLPTSTIICNGLSFNLNEFHVEKKYNEYDLKCISDLIDKNTKLLLKLREDLRDDI